MPCSMELVLRNAGNFGFDDHDGEAESREDFYFFGTLELSDVSHAYPAPSLTMEDV